MSAPGAAAVAAAVLAENPAAVRTLLAGVTEADRLALARALEPLPDGPTRERQEWCQLSRSPASAALAVGVADWPAAAHRALDQCHGRDHHVSDADWAAIAGVLADRNPPWLAEFVDDRLRGTGWRFDISLRPLARRLIRFDVIDRPVTPEYRAWMVTGLTVPAREGRRVPEPAGTGGDLLARAILDDPGLLEHQIWRLFTDPGVGKEMEDANGQGQHTLGEQWTDALLELAGQGHLDRGRLLDECLAAFLRDFPPNQAGWYGRFHDRLGPSPEEAAARSATYLALLAARSKTGISLGQRMCAWLLDAESGQERLDPEAFLAASGPALLFPQKSVAMAQLKLIGKLAAARPGRVTDRALATAAQAFAHHREDVQAAALKLIARHDVPQDASARAAVIELAAALSPVLRADAQALGLVPAPQAPAISPAATAAARPAPVARLARVEEPAGLVLLLTRLMEDASDALAVERALAGAVRLAALPLAERAQAARPLLKRARKQALADFDGPFSGYAIRADVGWLALTWGTGKLPPASTMEHLGWHPQGHDIPWQTRRPEILSGILSARIGEACTLIAAGRALQLLAEPELADGTVSPGELAARQDLWAAAELTPCRYDLEAARLRAAPGTDSAPHCRRLLVRMSHSLDDRKFAVHRIGVRLDEMVAAWHLACPRDPELTAAHLLSPLSDGLGPGRNAAVTAVRGLAGLTGAFGKTCHLALVTGLSGASADVRIAAAEAWTRIAGEGRLDPALAAGAIETGVTGGALKCSRIADGLGYAITDPGAAAAVARACLAAAAALLPAKPAGLHLLLELAARASTVSGTPELPEPVAALARGKGASKLAEAARRVGAGQGCARS